MARAIPPFLILIVLAFAAGTLSAQVTTGTPPFGSFGGGPDIVNLANLNVQYRITAIHRAGRELPFNFDLSYNSSVWYPVGSSSLKSWTPASATWGLAVATQIGYMTYNVKNTFCNGNTRIPLTIYSNWTYVDPTGTPHLFNIATWADTSTPCTTTSKTATAADGSGYTIKATGGGAVFYSPDGSTIYPFDYPNSPSSGLIQDRNGNQISGFSAGGYTDTLGGTALSVSGAAPNPTTYTYTAPGPTGTGTPAAVTVTYRSYIVQTHFGCSNVTEFNTNGTTQYPLVDKITLADQSSYQFVYEPTLGGVSGAVTGRPQSVKLPTGGVIAYTYLGGDSTHNGINCVDGSAAGLQRSTPDTGSNFWSYVRTAGTGTAYTTKGTDPQGNDTVVQFQGLYETQRQTFQGSSTSGTLLQTTNTCYNGSSAPCLATSVTLPITQRTVTTQFGSSGLQSQHTEFHNSYGLNTEVDDRDYGSGGPGPLLRKTLTTYASLGNGIVDRVASTSVQDGAGNTIAQTTYAYDETTPAATSGTPQHISITGSRGNATTIKNSCKEQTRFSLKPSLITTLATPKQSPT